MPGITDRFIFKAHGETAGSVTAKAFPDQRAHWVKFKAAIDNAGNVFIGKAGVTKMAGTDTTTGGWPLDAGQETDWLPCDSGNLDEFYLICDNAGDDCAWQCN